MGGSLGRNQRLNAELLKVKDEQIRLLQSLVEKK